MISFSGACKLKIEFMFSFPVRSKKSVEIISYYGKQGNNKNIETTSWAVQIYNHVTVNIYFNLL